MFWSAEKIIKFAETENIVRPYNKGKIDCNAYALSVGAEYFITSDGKKKKSNNFGIRILQEDNKNDAKEGFLIPSGQFAFLITHEVVKIPKNAMGFISLKTKKAKFKGLVNISGFHVDPGYHGKLIFSVFNAGPSPIHIKRAETLFLLWIADIGNIEHREPHSDYVKKDPNPTLAIDGSIVSDVTDKLTSIQDMSFQIRDLEKKIDRIHHIGAAITAISVLLILILNWSRIIGTAS